jgi:tetratricopeptide (TPR) repeat protein
MHFDEAKRFFELAADLVPLAAAKDGMGCVELLKGDPGKAVVLFQEAYQMDATYDEALLNLALAHDIRGDKEGAMSIYLEYLDKSPDSVRARNNLAVLEYDRGGGRMEVLHALSKAEMLSPNRVLSQNIDVVRRSRGN